MSHFVVTVPIRGEQGFSVEARSARHAKTKVRRWISGTNSAADDVEPYDIDGYGTKDTRRYRVQGPFE